MYLGLSVSFSYINEKSTGIEEMAMFLKHIFNKLITYEEVYLINFF